MPINNKFYRNDFSRMFLMAGTAGPAVTPEYMGLWRAGSPTNNRGDVTLVRNPSPSQYGAFDVVGKILGAPGNPELPIMARYTQDKSRLLQLANGDCDHDLQVHMGECKNPQDFNRGWNKILVLEAGHITSWRTGDLGALDPSERALTNEEVPFAGEAMYEITQLALARKADTEITQEIVAVAICDAPSCGLCGLASDGCQVVFSVEKSTGASPGIFARVVWTKNGGATWFDDDITTLTVSESPTDAKCSGTYLIVVNGTAAELHYKAIADIAAGVVGSWTEVTTGFSASGLPRKIFAASPADVWIVGTGGYIYHSTDIPSGVSIQDAGVATSQQLNAVHGADALNVVAVGNSNAVVVTENGGDTWRSVTGPAVGVNLNAVFMVTALRWFVGTNGGKLFYTEDAGTTWVEKAFPGSGAGIVYDVTFANRLVGYMAHATAAPLGRILRTINGGASWYVTPEGQGSIPTNLRINDVEACLSDVNIVYGGGLGTGTDGILVLGAGAGAV